MRIMTSQYIVLSRKYRPKLLEELIGQQVVVQSLRSCLENHKVPHAFLFHGIRGVGKTTVARILARTLSCTKIETSDSNEVEAKSSMSSNPCGKCKSCIAFDQNRHLDIMEVDAASRTGVEDIRDIIDTCQYMPILGKYKIFIIDEIHMLSKNAFNALLKTIEEPPEHIKFIFATTEVNKVPDTILSRCMTFQLKPVQFNILSEYLINIAGKEQYTLDPEASGIITEESEGSVRDALSILEQVLMATNANNVVSSDIVLNVVGGARHSDIIQLLDFIILANIKEALKKSEDILRNGADPFGVFKQLQKELYICIINTVKNKSKYKLSNLLYLWQILLKQYENMKNAIFPECILNATIVILAKTASFPDIETLSIDKQLGNDANKELLNSVLDQFPEANITEVE